MLKLLVYLFIHIFNFNCFIFSVSIITTRFTITHNVNYDYLRKNQFSFMKDCYTITKLHGMGAINNYCLEEAHVVLIYYKMRNLWTG
jgi:hypothetical protein